MYIPTFFFLKIASFRRWTLFAWAQQPDYIQWAGFFCACKCSYYLFSTKPWSSPFLTSPLLPSTVKWATGEHQTSHNLAAGASSWVERENEREMERETEQILLVETAKRKEKSLVLRVDCALSVNTHFTVYHKTRNLFLLSVFPPLLTLLLVFVEWSSCVLYRSFKNTDKTLLLFRDTYIYRQEYSKYNQDDILKAHSFIILSLSLCLTLSPPTS